MIMLVATLNIFLKDPSELAAFLSVALCYLVSLTCSRLFFLLTAHRLGSLSEGLVFVIFYSELYGRLIHCPADGRNKRKIKLPRSESIQSRINSGEFTSPSETAAAAFSVEDACRHFDGLEVNVGVKGGGGHRKSATALGESGWKELRGRRSTRAAGGRCIDRLPRLFSRLCAKVSCISGTAVQTLNLQIIWLYVQPFPEERLSDKLASNLEMDGDKEVEPCSLPQRTAEG